MPIRAYRLEQGMNVGKTVQVEAVVGAYRQTAGAILRRQWRLLLETGRLDKNAPVKPIESPLSERYKQTVQYQVVAMLKSWLGNRQNEFIDLVRGCDLDATTRMQWAHSQIVAFER